MELDLGFEAFADFVDAAQGDDVGLLEESPQARCPNPECGMKVDLLPLFAQAEEGDVPECPECHQDIRDPYQLKPQVSYRFTAEAAAEVQVARAAASGKPQLVAVLLCAIDDELDQLRGMLEDVGSEPLTYHPDLGSAVYITTRFEGAHINWLLHVAVTGQTNASAAGAAAVAMASKRPNLVFFIGIAGGVDDVKLGDVVVADRVYDYEVGKETASGFTSRAPQERASAQLFNWARALRGDHRWRQRIRPYDRRLLDPAPDVKIGSIAAGSKVVATTETALAAQIRQAAPKAVAVEMEGSGFLSAVFDFPAVKGLLVRGISDMLDEKAKSDDEGWRHQAAANAVAFVFEVLAQYKP